MNEGTLFSIKIGGSRRIPMFAIGALVAKQAEQLAEKLGIDLDDEDESTCCQ